ncbi:MAG: hypothetical protein KDE27_06160 [Planctomycetes bacterium]|nr:hypothetical protein [Planctomycetota bacterium]
MKLLSRLVALVLASLGLAQQQTRTVEVVDLEGTPYERGLTHGQALKQQIAALLPFFERDLADRSELSAAEFVTWFLESTRYGDAIRRHTPDLLDEVRGIAAGAGQPFETMLVYQLVDEYWVQSMMRRAEKCTSLGIARRDAQPTLVAQNLDIPAWMHRYPTVLRIHHSDSELQSLVVTVPGLIGAMGVNSGRVALAVNTILPLEPCRDGLPVAFVVRGALARPDVTAAREFVHSVRHASGQAYTIGGPDDVTCHECSANAVVRFVPAGGPERVWHTNHPVASDDYAGWLARAMAADGRKITDYGARCSRFAAIERGLAGDGPCGVEEIVALLSDPGHEVCNASTYACVVMSLGDLPALRITPGAPNVAEFTTVGFAAR